MSAATNTREAARVAAQPVPPIRGAGFDVAKSGEVKQRAQPRPKLNVRWGSITVYADRLRLGAYKDDVDTMVGLAADERDFAPGGSPIEVDIPRKDYRAYERACVAFNAIMDEHQAREDARNERRRLRRARA